MTLDTRRPGGLGRLTFTGKLMAPGVALLAVLSILPFIALVVMSLSHVRLLGGVRLEWAGLDNWVRVLTTWTCSGAGCSPAYTWP